MLGHQTPSPALAEHEAMAVGRAQRHLAAAPRLVGGRLNDLGALHYGAFVELVDRLHIEVSDVAVIAKFAGGHDISASTEHERDVSSPAEGPVAGIGVSSFASKDTREPGRRAVKVVHCENRI